MLSTLLLVSSALPVASKSVFIMILCNVLVVIVGRFATPAVDEAEALPYKSFFLDMTLPQLIGTCSVGHILGAAVILGLRGTGSI